MAAIAAWALDNAVSADVSYELSTSDVPRLLLILHLIAQVKYKFPVLACQILVCRLVCAPIRGYQSMLWEYGVQPLTDYVLVFCRRAAAKHSGL